MGKEIPKQMVLVTSTEPRRQQYTGGGTHCVLGKNNLWIQWLEVFFWMHIHLKSNSALFILFSLILCICI